MSVLPDSSWLNALKLPTQVMIGLFIACLILLVFDMVKILELKQFGEITKPIIIVISVLTGSLSITGIINFLKDQFMNKKKRSILTDRRRIRAEEIVHDREKEQNKALERLGHLSCNEISYLADCLRESSQSFYTYVHSPPVTTLMGKGLVYTPGGTHHQDYYPYTIQDFVWKELLDRQDEFLEKDARCKQEEGERGRNGSVGSDY